MSDVLTKAQRSYNMSMIRNKNTKPETVMRKALAGLRLRYHPKVYGSPDFASRKHMIAVFIDGCFWHGCQKCYVKPKGNAAFWKAKKERNMRRDLGVTKKLRADGWAVVRIWEHEVRKNPEKAARKITALISSSDWM